MGIGWTNRSNPVREVNAALEIVDPVIVLSPIFGIDIIAGPEDLAQDDRIIDPLET